MCRNCWRASACWPASAPAPATQLLDPGHGDLGTIVADERRLKQALYNLVSNALKFTPPSGSIVLGARRNDGHVEFRVTDTGIGIDPEYHAAVFEKFARVSSQGRSVGMGLGLALVKKLIELHGGRVELDSEPGHGTTVTCVVPVDATRTGEGRLAAGGHALRRRILEMQRLRPG